MFFYIQFSLVMFRGRLFHFPNGKPISFIFHLLLTLLAIFHNKLKRTQNSPIFHPLDSDTNRQHQVCNSDTRGGGGTNCCILAPRIPLFSEEKEEGNGSLVSMVLSRCVLFIFFIMFSEYLIRQRSCQKYRKTLTSAFCRI